MHLVAVHARRKIAAPPSADSATRGATGLVSASSLRCAVLALWHVERFVFASVLRSPKSARRSLLGLATLARVVVLIALASVIWVPVGVWIGLRPRLAQSCPADRPVSRRVPGQSAVSRRRLGDRRVRGSIPNIWLSPLMILGTQWYILFNVIAGAAAIPTELRDVGTNLQVRGWLWWTKIALPAVFPYYVTGAITASGGSWNASIVAEVASWGDTTLQARRPRRLHRAGDRRRRFPSHRARHRGDERLRDRLQPAVLAAALLVCRTQVPARMRGQES